MKHAGIDFQLATRYTSFIAISSTQDGASRERAVGWGGGSLLDSGVFFACWRWLLRWRESRLGVRAECPWFSAGRGQNIKIQA